MKIPTKSILAMVCLVSSALINIIPARADFPKPSLYPISWELNFRHDLPKRIVVEVPGASGPAAYWYLTYTVTNKTDREQLFFPVFELVTQEGKIIRSDNTIPTKVFEVIKERERIQFLEAYPNIAGELRFGDDQARDGVAIWVEPAARLGKFSVYVGGLSGESVEMKDEANKPINDPQGKPVILRKTLQLNYHIRGDEVFPGEDQVDERARDWVMR